MKLFLQIFFALSIFNAAHCAVLFAQRCGWENPSCNNDILNGRPEDFVNPGKRADQPEFWSSGIQPRFCVGDGCGNGGLPGSGGDSNWVDHPGKRSNVMSNDELTKKLLLYYLKTSQ